MTTTTKTQTQTQTYTVELRETVVDALQARGIPVPSEILDELDPGDVLYHNVSDDSVIILYPSIRRFGAVDSDGEVRWGAVLCDGTLWPDAWDLCGPAITPEDAIADRDLYEALLRDVCKGASKIDLAAWSLDMGRRLGVEKEMLDRRRDRLAQLLAEEIRKGLDGDADATMRALRRIIDGAPVTSWR